MSQRRRKRAASPRDREVPAPGQLLRRTLLGTTALYRVVGQDERGVVVEVVEVEGLRPGSRFTFSLEDVLTMERIRTP
jgi:hypothetical protein